MPGLPGDRHTVSERLEKRAAASITSEAMESASAFSGEPVGRPVDVDGAEGTLSVGQHRSRHRVDPLGEFLMDPAVARAPDRLQPVPDRAGIDHRVRRVGLQRPAQIAIDLLGRPLRHHTEAGGADVHRHHQTGVVTDLDGVGALHLHHVLDGVSGRDAEAGGLTELIGQPDQMWADRGGERSSGIDSAGKLDQPDANRIRGAVRAPGHRALVFEARQHPGHGRLGQTDP